LNSASTIVSISLLSFPEDACRNPPKFPRHRLGTVQEAKALQISTLPPLFVVLLLGGVTLLSVGRYVALKSAWPWL
jgi:hypothetical protein